MHFFIKGWLILTLFLAGCLAHEPELTEPWRTEEAPTEPSEEVVDSTVWIPEDFPFVLYRQIVSSRESTENIVISPVTALIELDAVARESEPDLARGIAERLGFSGDVAAMNAHVDGLVAELEARKPGEGRIYQRRGGYYEVLEEDEERVRRALGIQWVSVQGRLGSENDEFEDRLSEESDGFFSGNDFTIEGLAEGSFDLRALLLVGEWEGHLSPRSIISGEFRRHDGEVVIVDTSRRSFAPALTVRDDAVFMEWALLGQEVSVFLLLPAEGGDLSELEDGLTTALMEEWIESLTLRREHIGNLPLLDLNDFVDLSPHFANMGFEEVTALNRRLLQPSRFVLGLEGVNHPEPVRRQGHSGSMGLRRTEPSWSSFDRPFLFFIYDRPSSTVLLMGRVASP